MRSNNMGKGISCGLIGSDDSGASTGNGHKNGHKNKNTTSKPSFESNVQYTNNEHYVQSAAAAGNQPTMADRQYQQQQFVNGSALTD